MTAIFALLIAVEPVTTVIVVGAILGLLGLFAVGGKKGGTGEPDVTNGGGAGGGGTGTDVPTNGPTPGNGPTKPKGNVPTNVPVDPEDLGGGGAWGVLTKIPAEFNWNGNGWWIANDCTAIAVGKAFAPETYTKLGEVKRKTITTLQSVTQIGVPPPNTGTLWNFLWHLWEDVGLREPSDMAARVLVEMSLNCSKFPEADWPQGLKDFYRALYNEVLVFYVEVRPPSIHHGGVWGNVANVPLDFDFFDGNKLFISGDCETVAQGRWFWPEASLMAQGEKVQIKFADNPPSLAAALAPGPRYTVEAFVDFLAIPSAETQPQLSTGAQVANRILLEGSPHCSPVANRGDGVVEWHEDLKQYATNYLAGGIKFG